MILFLNDSKTESTPPANACKYNPFCKDFSNNRTIVKINEIFDSLFKFQIITIAFMRWAGNIIIVNVETI